MGRAPCCEKVGLKRGRWTAEEDEILTNYIQANGEGSWRSLPKNAGLLRCGKSCRLRWINYLRSDLKRGNISAEEEEIIMNLHESLGSRWSLIAGHLAGRTDNEIKNYWNSHLSRKLVDFKKSDSNAQPAAAVLKKRKGSRSKMKKNRRSIPSQSKELKEPATATVQMPRTPTLGKETLSSAISWKEENMSKITNSIMDPYPKQESIENLANTSSNVCTPEDGETETSLMLQPQPAVEWATCEGVVGLDGGILFLDEMIMSDGGELADPDGNLTFPGSTETCESETVRTSVERECGSETTINIGDSTRASNIGHDDDQAENNKFGIMDASNGENGGEWISGSSAARHEIGKLDDGDDWQWYEHVFHDNLTTLGEEADVLSWLWDSDNNNNNLHENGDCDYGIVGTSAAAVEMEDEKHNALVDWLLS